MIPAPATPRWAPIVFANAAVLIGLLVVLEGMLRLAGYSPSDFFSYGRYFGDGYFPSGYYTREPERGFDITPDFDEAPFAFGDATLPIFSNVLGCMDRTPLESLRSQSYVLLLGDSFTWGFARYEQKWGTLVEQRTGVPIAKCGASHSGQRHQLSKAREVVAGIGMAPRLVVVGYYANDPQDDAAYPSATVYRGILVDFPRGAAMSEEEREAILEARYLEWRRGQSAPLAIVRNHSVAANAAWSAVNYLRRMIVNDSAPRQSIGAGYNSDAEFAANREALILLRDWCDAIGAQLLVVLVPGKAMADDFYAPVRTFLERSEIDLVDPLARFHARSVASPMFWTYDSHLNVAGNAVLADILAAEIAGRLH